ncbi:MAG: glycosyltransferase family 4 protein [Prolixibacteraceae bacterium]|nr:glycosyltransferase family 4 protein [Prolixibacteraceae bacterium]
MKKVLIITYYWPPSGGAGVQRWLKFSKYLPEFGWKPVILTVDPNFSSYPQIDETLQKEVNSEMLVFRTKSREFYSMYRSISGNNIPYGGFSNDNKKSPVQKLAKIVRGNLFIPDPRRGWIKFAFKKAKELIKTYDIDTVITTSPPHSTQLIGLKLKKKLNIRWIADLRDPWTDIYYYNQFKHTKLALAVDRCYERNVITAADMLITVSEDLKRIFSTKDKNNRPEKIHVIQNGFDEEDFKTEVKPEAGKKIITYTGTISENYDIEGFVNAVNKLEKSIRDKIKIQFIGNVSEIIREKIQRTETEVEFIGYIPHNEAIENMLKSSMLLLIIPNVENNKGIVTGKFFEYLASGKPVLAIGPKGGDLETIIAETNCGKLFNYTEENEISVFITDYLMENKTLDTKGSNYSRRALTERLSMILSNKI